MYNCHSEWIEEFLFTLVKDKCVCMLCHQTQALSKRRNLERYHNNNHQKFKDSHPPKSTIHARKVDKPKSGLKAQQSLFPKPAAQNKDATEASFLASHILAKHEKPFTDVDLFKKQWPFPQRLQKQRQPNRTVWWTAWSCNSDKEGRVTVRGRGSTSVKGLVTAVYSSMNLWM